MVVQSRAARAVWNQSKPIPDLTKTMQNLLSLFDLEEQFRVKQADAMLLECRDCGDEVRADVADLHGCVQ